MANEEVIIFDGLNIAQSEAVKNTEGPSLILAGAGSGKTKVLTCKIANILNGGCSPGAVLALTFTNKASAEMKERIAAVVGERHARRLWMGTFHSIFARFLREEAELIGFPKTYTIYDTNDSRNIVKACIKELQLDDKIYKPNEIFSRISMAKNNLITAQTYASNNSLKQIDASSKRPLISDIYSLYARKCFTAGAMDFDDILLFTNILFRDHPDALERIRNRFKYILVDEFQDTNLSQYLIIKKLASDHRNITVVGDDAQSIYSFRGARIENILNFKKDFPDTKEFKLERNYRSTQTIVNAANSIINKNTMQFKKNCYSEQEEGDKIQLINAFTEQEEGFLVASSISETMYAKRANYGDFVILYRTNAQSRVIEEALRRKNMPYKIFAAHSFYERAEIKGAIAYFRLCLNEKDDESLLRIINFPPRGIGETSLGRLREWANAKGASLSDVLKSDDFEQYGLKEVVVRKMRAFVKNIEDCRAKLYIMNAYEMALDIDKCFGIMEYFRQDTSLEGQSRLQNIEELFNSIKEFVEEGEEESLSSDSGPDNVENGHEKYTPLISMDLYIQNISLISDMDTKEGEDEKNKISLMTVHSAKGLEFPYVYIIGAEENLFPSTAGTSSEKELEEERRLFYVALTRAKDAVKISFSHSRMKWGSHVNNSPSRFIKEIDNHYIANPLNDGEPMFRNDRLPETSANIVMKSGKPRFGNVEIARRSNVIYTKNPNFVSDSPTKMKTGQKVEHERFGEGIILSMEGNANDMKAVVDFKNGGKKTLLLKFAKIRIISE